MRKRLLLFLSLTFSIIAFSQVTVEERNAAMQLVNANRTAIGLSENDISNLKVTNAYYSATSGLMLVYLQQTYKDIPVYNQIQVLAFKNDSLVSNAGGRIPGIENLVNTPNGIPAVSAEAALLAAISDRNLKASGPAVIINRLLSGNKYEFSDMGVSHENITVELMWSPDESGKSVHLSWQVYIVSKATPDYWLVRVDGHNKNILGLDNLTVYDHWEKPGRHTDFSPVDNNKVSDKINYETSGKFNGKSESSNSLIVNGASYRVIPFPAESPLHPGGTPALVTNPWLAAAGNATTLNWHSNGTLDYNITRGNNVWAKEDRAGNNSTAGLPATSSTSPDPLTFDFTPNFTVPPTQLTPVPNQQFNITNLFYWMNIFHDVTYLYGFDEPAGNFQANNQGRGGLGNDWVNGDAQDGSGLNNANFSTPVDGSSGRMQMYLWSAIPNFVVNSPGSIAGAYNAVESAFSTNNLLQNVGPKTGQVVYYDDDLAGNTHYACAAPANSVSGKIALIVRGFGGTVCTATVPFTVKVKNAQDAGAIAVIMVNNVAGAPIPMGGTDNTITIPAIMISQSDGAIIAAQLANNVNVTMSAGVEFDGDVDNGIVVHEFAHGISNRLTGGPGNSSCLGNAEQMGEGWSDYYSLMLTQNWATSNINTGFNSPRGIGTYANGEGPNGAGIRTQKYCTDFSVNNKVYAASLPTSQHDRGEIWCATLWDMTWNIIQQNNLISPSIYNASSTGGNCIALKLVTEAMKLQPCSPGFITGRDAILQADAILYNGLYECAIREAFRRRGMGPGASQGSSGSVTDQVPDFSLMAVNISTQPQSAGVCEGSNHTFSVAATVNSGATPTYQWQLSTDGGTNYNNTGVTTPSYTLTNISVSMNNYRYRSIVNGKCATAVTSGVAILTVSQSVSITQQPTGTTVCESGNTSFSVTGSGAGITYQWQVSTDGGTNYSNITNGGVYSGVTAATLTLSGVTASFNAYRYRAIISSTSCPAPSTSNTAILSVNIMPSISAQAQNAAVCNGGNTTFNISASGSGISYQWQENSGSGFNNVTNGGAYSGATTASLTITGATSGMSGYQYRSVISGTCTPPVNSNSVALTVSSPVNVTASPSDVVICETGNSTFSAAGSGSGIIYQWQVSTNSGISYNDIVNGGVYSGATTATLSLTNIAQGMNDYRYRVVMSNAACNVPATSAAASLTVNARPTVTLSASPYTKLLPGFSTTLTASILPSSSGFTISWLQNGSPLTGVIGTTYTANITKLGNYRVDIVNILTGCNNQSNLLAISDSASSKLFIFPSPNNGLFTVAYYNSGGGNANRTVTVYDSKGARVYYSKFEVTGPYSLLEIKLISAQRGIYHVVVGDGNGKKLIADKVLVH